MEIKLIATNKLKYNELNPRQLKDKGFKQIVRSIKRDPKFLQARPILYTKVGNENIVFAGNQRLRACIENKMSEVYAMDCSELTKKEIDRLTIIDNTHSGEWDFDLLANSYELDDLKDFGLSDYDLKLMVFDDSPVDMGDIAETGFQHNQRKLIEEEANRIAREKYLAEKEKIERETKEKLLSDIKSGKQEISIDMLSDKVKEKLADEIKKEESKEPNYEDLIGVEKNKKPSIKITFNEVDELFSFETEIKPILSNYKNSFYSVSGGEL